MAGEYDEKLDEMMGLLRKTADGVDDLRVEVRDLRSGLREATGKIEETTAKVEASTIKIEASTIKIEANTIKIEHLTGRFEDVAKVVIQDTQRITGLEQRLGALEGEAH